MGLDREEMEFGGRLSVAGVTAEIFELSLNSPATLEPISNAKFQ
jgi:hypothetical protein